MTEYTRTNQFALKGRIAWLYVKYQIITKLILAIAVLPTFGWLTSLFIGMSGRTNISSGDFIGFFLSLYGLPVIILGILLLILILGIDINTFIIISSLVEEDKLNIKIKDVLTTAIQSLKHFFSPLGVVLVVYSALALPLIGFGVTMGPLQNFKIPNFITSVIFNNGLYSALYFAALAALTVLGLIYIFTIHFILLDRQPILTAFRSSRQLMKKYWKRFIGDYVVKMIKYALLFLLIALLAMIVVLLIDKALSGLYQNDNISLIVLMLTLFEIFSFISFMMAPVAIFVLTKLFYKYNLAEGHPIENKLNERASALRGSDFNAKIKFKTKVEVIALFAVILALNFATATILESNFYEIFDIKIDKALIAHRGGGDLGAENTIAGIEVAIAEGVSWTEIDVQRTADGAYIINHDATFARVAGVDKKPIEMTLAEIRALRVENQFQADQPAQPVPTLDELLDACKGKIGVFVELKGKSADYQMVDDVVAIIDAKQMGDECVILSLDYDIIAYTHDHYPQIKTGFLYYFSVGALKNLKGDYLIMEEREATPEKIDEIHEAGKKAIVWTVNTPESIEQFIKSDVDGIITDYVMRLKEAIAAANQRSHLEIIIDSFE